MITVIVELDLLPLVSQRRVKVNVVLSGRLLGLSSRLVVAVDAELCGDGVKISSSDVKEAALRSNEVSLIDHAHTPELENETDAESRKLAFTLILEAITVLTTIKGADALSTSRDTAVDACRDSSETTNVTAEEVFMEFSGAVAVRMGKLVDFAFKLTPQAELNIGDIMLHCQAKDSPTLPKPSWSSS